MLDKSSKMVAIATVQVETVRGSPGRCHWGERDAISGHADLTFSAYRCKTKLERNAGEKH